jgi:hypothetical protein
VLGDAGIGKTNLVRGLLGTLPRGVQVLAAACEDLLTPRTLGPLRDAVRGRDSPLADALTSGAEGRRVRGPSRRARSRTPTLLVVDDVHWADGATLDVLRVVVVGAGTRASDDPEAPIGNGRAIAVLAAREGAAVACVDRDGPAAAGPVDG